MRKRTFVLLALFTSGVIAWLHIHWRHLIRYLLDLPPVSHRIRVERNIPIEVQPGLSLIADHYYPRKPGNYPTILLRSPYGRELRGGPVGLIYGFLLRRFAERGYHVIAQDTRGRYESDGKFDPFTHEKWDGQATIRWIERQPWFNGQLGMTGPSYLGYTQWAAAIEPDRAPSLKAILPIMTTSQFHSVIHADGSFSLDMVLHWMQITYLAGRPQRRRRFISPFEEDRRLERVFDHLPLNEIDQLLLGERVQFYQDALTHPDHSALQWRWIDLSERVGDIEAAAHLLTGWHDFMLRELLADYQRLAEACRQPHLTIGPWYHADVNYLWEAIRQGVNWFDVQLKGQRHKLRQQPVRLYVMGANLWRDFDTWPPPSNSTAYYLREGRALSIEAPGAGEQPDRYRYDPAEPTPNLGGPLINLPRGAVYDNRMLEARSDVLTYTTPPLTRDLEIIGYVRLILYVRSSVSSTDFFGRLCDVQLDGRSLNVCDGLLRVTLSPDHASTTLRSAQNALAAPLKIEIDLWATAQRFLYGHRLRLSVSSGAHPRWARNLGCGEPIGSAIQMCAADQTIYHDSAHASALLLPCR
jgi:hypothetical protein